MIVIDASFFKIELTGLISRRAKPDTTLAVIEELFRDLDFLGMQRLFNTAMSIALVNWCRKKILI